MNDSIYKDEDYQLWWLILHARRAMHKARARELLQYGVTAEEAAVLFVIDAVGWEVTPSEISRWLGREPHSISELIRRMEKKGLVSKNKDLERKNMVRVAMTEKGQEAFQQSVKRESVYRIMSALSKNQCRQMAKCLEKLWDKALEEVGVSQKAPFPLPPPSKQRNK